MSPTRSFKLGCFKWSVLLCKSFCRDRLSQRQYPRRLEGTSKVSRWDILAVQFAVGSTFSQAFSVNSVLLTCLHTNALCSTTCQEQIQQPVWDLLDSSRAKVEQQMGDFQRCIYYMFGKRKSVRDTVFLFRICYHGAWLSGFVIMGHGHPIVLTPAEKKDRVTCCHFLATFGFGLSIRIMSSCNCEGIIAFLSQGWYSWLWLVAASQTPARTS